MTCEDCGFEYDKQEVCPRCGYDPSVNLVQCVALGSPQLTNSLEDELVSLSKKAETGEIAKERIQEQWRIVDNKAREGNLDARHLMGRAALMQQKYDTAHKIFARLADAGHILAQLDLARIYDEGLGVERDVFSAIKLYRLAATRGNPIALFKLAEMHGGNSDVLRQDPALANAIMSSLVAAYPNLFQRRQGCGGCSGGPTLTNGEFAAKTASQMSKMLKYLVIAAVIAFVAYVVFTEFFGS